MKLTTKSEYALLALIYIARRGNEAYLKLDDICAHYDIPKKYLEQLFIILKQNRFIKTRRGASGGYCLARPAASISLAEIIRCLDGALAPTESVSKYFFAETPVSQEKKLIRIFKDIRNYIATKLESLTLQELI